MKIVVPWRLIVWMMSKTCSTKTGASPIDGSSMHRSFGRGIKARPSATTCSSPAATVPAADPAHLRPPPRQGARDLPQPLLDARKQCETAIQIGVELGPAGPD